MSKIRMLFVVFAMAMMVFSNTANAGKVKTSEALKNMIATIEKADIPDKPALNDALERARDIMKNSWKMARWEVYKNSGVIYDDVISELEGTGVEITKPAWLH